MKSKRVVAFFCVCLLQLCPVGNNLLPVGVEPEKSQREEKLMQLSLGMKLRVVLTTERKKREKRERKRRGWDNNCC